MGKHSRQDNVDVDVRAEDTVDILFAVHGELEYLKQNASERHLHASGVWHARLRDEVQQLNERASGTLSHEKRLRRIAALAVHLVELSRDQRHAAQRPGPLPSAGALW